jgi:hypothetical protein
LRVVIDIRHPDPEVTARLAQHHLEGVVLANRLDLRRFGASIPSLYASGVRFRNEPWAGAGARGQHVQIEQFARIPEILERGWADCAQLVAWRVAEQREAMFQRLRRNGVPAPEANRAANEAYGIRIYWRLGETDDGTETRLFHVQVRNPDQSVEDPSRLLEF